MDDSENEEEASGHPSQDEEASNREVESLFEEEEESGSRNVSQEEATDREVESLFEEEEEEEEDFASTDFSQAEERTNREAWFEEGGEERSEDFEELLMSTEEEWNEFSGEENEGLDEFDMANQRGLETDLSELYYTETTAYPSPDMPDVFSTVSTEITEDKTVDDLAEIAPEDTVYSGADNEATVKFLEPLSHQVYTMRCHLKQTILDLKQYLASRLKIPILFLQIVYHDDDDVDNNTSLAQLGVETNGTVELEVHSRDYKSYPVLDFAKLMQTSAEMAEVVRVRIKADDGQTHVIIVGIERSPCKKPYLGGYRNKLNGQDYHNAATQTLPGKDFDEEPPEEGCTTPPIITQPQHTQTAEEQHLLMQTSNNMSTQMTGIGVYIPNLTDQLIKPGIYETADEFHARILKQVIIVQTYIRRWVGSMEVQRLLEAKKCVEEYYREKKIKEEMEKKKRLEKELDRRLHPTTNTDFDLLFTYLERWRQKEVDRIDQTFSGAERKAALCNLMDKQAELIHCIEMRRLDMADEFQMQYAKRLLNKVESGTQSDSDKQVVLMDDSTENAKELGSVFRHLNLKYLAHDERFDLLVTVRSILQMHWCSVASDLDKLINREITLLARGFSERGLEGLRKRISHLFLQFIKLPMVNPAITKFLRVPSDPHMLKDNTNLCSNCHRFLPQKAFNISSDLNKIGQCRDCDKLNNIARRRLDFSIFKFMLKNLCRSEDLYNDNAKIAYLMQENDMRYLVECIWHSKSVLSAHEDLHDLEMIRWNRCEEWSPWNCILLMKDEARAHKKYSNLVKAYGKQFIQEIHCRHLLAKKHFGRLLMMTKRMPDTSDKDTTVLRNLTKKYLAVNKCAVKE